MADLNSTIVRGNLRVTEEIIGTLNIANLSTGTNGQFLSISNNVPTWVNNPNTWRPLGTGANDAAAGNHSHSKSEVGLGNVDNTADANKRVDYANSAGSVAWDNISSKPITITQRNNDSPVSGAYAYGTYVTMRNTNNWLEIYAPHMGTSSSRVYMQTGWDNDRQGWKAIAWTSDIPTSLPANGGNAYTLDGKHSSDFCLSSSNITNLPINGGIYWNSYVESSSDGSDAASITVIKDGNGTGGTVLQIKQANDNNDIVNVVAGDLKLNGVSVSTHGHDHDDRYYTESEVNSKLDGKSNTGHTHSSIIDIGDSSKTTTFAYSKSGLNYGDYTWLAGWNGYELRAVNKSQFATSDHTHDDRYYTKSEMNTKLNGKSDTGHTHSYLPLGGGALTGTLNLQNSSAGISFTRDWYITNIETGSVNVNIGTASAGYTTSITATFKNYNKGLGSWYVVATVRGASPAQPECVVAGIGDIGSTGIKIRVRKIANNSSGANPTWSVHYIAIKYH